MKMMGAKAIVVIGLVVVAGIATTQGGPKRAQKKPSRVVTQVGAPVSHQEVNATLTRVEKAMSTLPGMRTFKPTARMGKAGVASREYIIGELDKLFERLKPNFKFTPRKVAFDAKRIVVKPASKGALEKLIAWGCIARVGPLATGPKDTIGLREFGDAVGMFVARMSDLTHSPDPKFSPWMNERPAGGG